MSDIKTRTRMITAKIETVYGVDAGPAGSDVILAIDSKIIPMDGKDESRELDQGYFGGQATIPLDLHAKLTFKVEIVGSGTVGTPPGYSALLRACGIAETITANTSVVYNPVTEDHESATLYFYIGNTRHVLAGARGDVEFELTASGIARMAFEFTGLFSVASEQARVVPNYSAFQKPRAFTDANTPTFTLDGNDFVLRSLMLKVGNQVEPRFLINDERIIITDRAETAEFVTPAVPMTTFNPYQAALNQQSVALQLVHETLPGRIVTFDIPNMQLQRPQGLEDAQGIAEWTIGAVPLLVAGDDQWTLTFT
ncbi:MAG: phage tail tube protein [Pseudomonadota bacterium]